MDHDAALKVAAVALQMVIDAAPDPEVTRDGEGEISIAVTGQSNEHLAKVAVEAYLQARGIKT